MNILAIRTFQRLAASLCASILLFAAATAQAEQRPTFTTHVPEAVARGVAPLIGHLPSEQRLSLAISLPLRNEADLDELLEQLYDPQSPSFRHYLSVQDFTSRFAPTESDYSAVLGFAENNGLAVIDTAANRMVVDIEGPAANIESAFHLSMNVYQHPTEARIFYAPDREPTPDLDVPLLHISGLDNFTLPRAKNVRSSPDNTQAQDVNKTTGSGPGGQFIASDMRAAYYGSGPLNGTGQSVGLFEYAGYEISDVNLYFKNVKQTLKVPVKGVSLNGVSLNCPPSSCDDSEQVLDIEMAISMAPGLKQVVVYVGSSDVSIFNRMAVDNTSKQLSCSWGWSDDESSLDPIFKEMAMQGQTVFVATGDNGSSTPADVVWPADDPYITAVGGTDLTTTGPGGAWKSETGWNGSAGMPSKNKVPIPSYQKLAGVINPLNRGSKTYRNIPDVAAEANTNQYSCYDGSCSGGNGGTSYAAPQWAGLTALANQQSIAGGGKALGFLNPAIYDIGVGASYHKDFHDITSGSNGRYSAVTGYDLVTGWGSPDGSNLIDALVAAAKTE
ncbi:MAG TPA: S53 family peptidase [Candidatus Eremiobacteraceae bacterium]|nr:S53 family peptidase [Candidatus Eremiobacteraceae bacterium]